MEVYSMKKGKKICIIIIIFFIVSLLLTEVITSSIAKNNYTLEGKTSTYTCDVKHFLRLKTRIRVYEEGTQKGEITGNFAWGIFKQFHDPLEYRDIDGTLINESSDKYHFITQDDHTVVDNNQEIVAVMKGRFKIFGEMYDIYDRNGNCIGVLKVGFTDTSGGLYNAEGELVATYKSHLLFKDYQVEVGDKCEFEDDIVIMLFANYYSDHAANISGGSSSSSSSN